MRGGSQWPEAARRMHGQLRDPLQWQGPCHFERDCFLVALGAFPGTFGNRPRPAQASIAGYPLQSLRSTVMLKEYSRTCSKQGRSGVDVSALHDLLNASGEARQLLESILVDR